MAGIEALIRTAEISAIVVAGMWAPAFLVYGIRRIFNGPDVAEPIDAAFIAKYSARSAADKWYHRILVSFDVLVNVTFRGQASETISGRSWRASLEHKLWGRAMNFYLNLYQSQHGPKAAVGDLQRAEAQIITNSAVLGIK